MFRVLLTLSLLLATTHAAPLAAPTPAPRAFTYSIPGVGTVVGGDGGFTAVGLPGTIEAGSGTFKIVGLPGTLKGTTNTITGQAPVITGVFGKGPDGVLTFSGGAPEFTGSAALSPGGGFFTGVGPLGTLGAGFKTTDGKIGASFTAIGTIAPLSGYDAGGVLSAGPSGATGVIVATNAHSTIKGTLTFGPGGAGVTGTAQRPGLSGGISTAI